MADPAAMTVNERLYVAGLLDIFEAADANGDTDEVDRILAKVNLRRDAAGMYWSLNNGNNDAPNN